MRAASEPRRPALAAGRLGRVRGRWSALADRVRRRLPRHRHQLRDQIDTELGGRRERARAQACDAGEADDAAADATRRRTLRRGQPFAATSTLLFTIDARRAARAPTDPSCSRAEAPDNGESASEQAQENRLSARLLSARGGYLDADAARRRRSAPAQALRAAGGRQAVTVGVGEPLATVTHAQAGRRARVHPRRHARAGGRAARRVSDRHAPSRPLRRMAVVAARVDGGDLHPRIHDPGGQCAGGARADRRVQPHARPAHRGVRGTARIRRRRLARAAHAVDRDRRAARGARRTGRTPASRRCAGSRASCRPRSRGIGRLVDDLLLLAQIEQTEFLQVEQIDLAPLRRAICGTA